MRPRKITTQKQGAPPEASGADTREQLLDAAAALFAEHGIAATTVAKIAALVGVTSAMIHYYFKTRDQLLDAIVQERIVQFIAFVWDPIANDEDDPTALITGLIDRIASFTDAKPWLPPLWIGEVINEGGLLRERVLQHIPVDRLKLFVACIASGQKKGTVNPDLDPRLLFMSVLGLTILPLAMARVWNVIPIMNGVSRDDITRHATALILHGLVSPEAVPGNG
ncbi:MAG: TetR family transcriptional regulator [Geobacteraceae bacterium GWC2_58_44]|nr:MAG: TetR family transcriptional regulator [Geobacteraceae bacterium GWC2_58_44]HBG07146.1 TetR family transcriptional regulator [Geobacter sp.]